MKKTLENLASSLTTFGLLAAALWTFTRPGEARAQIDPDPNCTCLIAIAGPIPGAGSPSLCPGAVATYTFVPRDDGWCAAGTCGGEQKDCEYDMTVELDTSADCCLTITCGTPLNLQQVTDPCGQHISFTTSGHGRHLACNYRRFYRTYTTAACPWPPPSDCISLANELSYVRITCKTSADC